MRIPLIALTAALGLAVSTVTAAASAAVALVNAATMAPSSAAPVSGVGTSFGGGSVGGGSGHASGGGGAHGAAGSSAGRGGYAGHGSYTGHGGYSVIGQGLAGSARAGLELRGESRTSALGPSVGSAAAATRVTDRFHPRGPPHRPRHPAGPARALYPEYAQERNAAMYCTTPGTLNCPIIEMPQPFCIEPIYLNTNGREYFRFDCAVPVKVPLRPADRDESGGDTLLLGP